MFSTDQIRHRILDRVNDLTRPQTTRERAWTHYVDRDTHRPVSIAGLTYGQLRARLRPDDDDDPVIDPLDKLETTRELIVEVQHPSLLDQLRDAIEGTTTAAISGPGYESKPAARLGALDTLERIRREARYWIEHLLHDQVGGRTLPAQLQHLAAKAWTLDDEMLANLDADVRSWHSGARCTTGWDTPASAPYVRCPCCEHLQTLRIRLDPISAYCIHCGEGWDAATIGVLGHHVQIMEQARREDFFARADAKASNTHTEPGIDSCPVISDDAKRVPRPFGWERPSLHSAS